jgi:hypothetical protein
MLGVRKAQAVAQGRSQQERPHPLGGAGAAIRSYPLGLDPHGVRFYHARYRVGPIPETACLMPRFDLCIIVTYYQSSNSSRVAREAEVVWLQQCVLGM